MNPDVRRKYIVTKLNERRSVESDIQSAKPWTENEDSYKL